MVSFLVPCGEGSTLTVVIAQEMKFGDNAEDFALAEDVEERDRREVSR